MTSQPELHDLLQRGIELARTGHPAEARAIFEQVIRADEFNEVAWLWMAAAAENNAQRREALEIVLEINPQNEQARDALEKLGGPRARRKAEQAQALADRIGIEAAGTEAGISEAAFQAVVERPVEPEPEPEPILSPEEREARLTEELLAMARREQERAEVRPAPAAVPTTPSAPEKPVEYYDFRREQRARLWRRIGVIASTLLIVLVGTMVTGLVIVGLGQLLQPVPPTATPTPGLQTALALLATATPTANPVLIVTADQNERFIYPPTWTPSHTPTATPTFTPSPTGLPPGEYSLIYSGRGDDEAEYRLFTIRGDGSGRTALTDGSGDDRSPAPGPDGRRVLYATNIGDEREVALITLPEASAPAGAGLNPTPITHLAAAYVDSPSWSPDGFRFAFSVGAWNEEDIYLTDVDGSSIVNLTSSERTIDRDPAWSPDGRTIVFASDRGTPGETEIFSIQPDAGNLRQLTDSAGSSYQPAWSPDGRHIVFVSDRGGDSDLYIMNADGTNEQLLTRNDGGAEDRNPAWSPDGRWIAFSSTRETESFQIFLIEPFGTRLVQVTRGPGEAIEPAWLAGPDQARR